MKRIASILAILGAALLISPPAQAGTVGVILEEDTPYYVGMKDALEAAILEASPGTRVFVQKPGPTKVARLNAINRAEAAKADVLVTLGPAVTRVAANAERKAALVFVITNVGKLTVPTSKNMTGIAWQVPIADVFRRLGQLKPFKKVAVMHAGGGEAREEWKAIQGLGGGIEPVLVDVRQENLDAAFDGIDAIYACGSACGETLLPKVIEGAKARKLPVFTTRPGVEEAGVVLSLCPDPDSLGRQAGDMVGKLLGGTKTAEVSPRTETASRLVVNRRVAVDLGLSVSAELAGDAAALLE